MPRCVNLQIVPNVPNFHLIVALSSMHFVCMQPAASLHYDVLGPHLAHVISQLCLIYCMTSSKITGRISNKRVMHCKVSCGITMSAVNQSFQHYHHGFGHI